MKDDVDGEQELKTVYGARHNLVRDFRRTQIKGVLNNCYKLHGDSEADILTDRILNGIDTADLLSEYTIKKIKEE